MFNTDVIKPSALAILLLACFPFFAQAAALDDIAAVPHLDSEGQQAYRDFLDFDPHRAFAIAPGGGWAWKSGAASAQAAADNTLRACREDNGQSCALYALDDKVVFDDKTWARSWRPYATREQAGRAPVGSGHGQRFYNLSFTGTDGKTQTLADLRGQVVVLHFWGSWCPVCVKEMPELQQFQNALGASKGVKLVMLQMRETAQVSRQWLAQHHYDLPQSDSGARDRSDDQLHLADGKILADREIAPAFPTTYILDKHGIVLFSRIGPLARWPQYLPLLRDAAAYSGK